MVLLALMLKTRKLKVDFINITNNKILYKNYRYQTGLQIETYNPLVFILKKQLIYSMQLMIYMMEQLVQLLKNLKFKSIIKIKLFKFNT